MGFCQDYRAIKDFCTEHNLIFLEDNAGGFYSIVNGKKMGSFGDVSITCVRKTLPLINGSYLAINNSDLMKKANLPNNLNLFKEKREFFQLIRSFYRWFSNSSTFPRRNGSVWGRRISSSGSTRNLSLGQSRWRL